MRLVLGDQLTPGVAALRGLDKSRDVVLMAEVLDIVERKFAGNFGKLRPFGFAVTRKDAEAAFEHFIDHACLAACVEQTRDEAYAHHIQRMADYCTGCKYDPTDATGEGACPFSYLYWDFLMRNRERLSTNQRLRTIYSSLDRMDLDRVKAIQVNARRFLNALG